MIGIPNFKLHRLAVVSLLALTGVTQADEVTLEGDARLEGKVTAILDGGATRLESPLSAEPLTLRAGSVKKVVFADSAATPQGSTRVKLKSGDVIPCELKALDADTLTVGTVFSNDLKIPRNALGSLELGIASQNAIYAAANDLDGWSTKTWKFKDGAFVSGANGTLSRKFDLPDQFILRFRISWKNMPNLRIFFSDPLEARTGPIDRYFMQFNNAGFALQRQNSSGRTYIPFVNLSRRPDSFPDSQMEVEVRVDRTQSMVWLYLNGNLEGRFNDPAAAPKGGGISFESNAGNDSEQRISDFRVMSWDATGDRHRTEERGDKKSDSLIDSEGDRYSGRLESLTLGDNSEATLLFKSPLLEKVMSIPAKRVSTVFFADGPAPAETAPATLVLKLRDGGRIRIDQCSFSGDSLQVRHPLLGLLPMKRSSVLSIEQAPKPSDPKPEE
jgi:hypothetical protein